MKKSKKNMKIESKIHSRQTTRCDTFCIRPLSPQHYIGFLPAADVVEAEVLNTEALLRLVETPQPLALQRPSLALPSLTTPETTQT